MAVRTKEVKVCKFQMAKKLCPKKKIENGLCLACIRYYNHTCPFEENKKEDLWLKKSLVS
jgi:hypothetical protein